MKNIRKEHGIYSMLSLLNLFQIPVHMVWVSLINRMAFNYDKNPELLTQGLLWFKDLSQPDPFCILPVIGAGVTLMTMMSNTNAAMNATMRKMRRYMFILPLLSIPIWMTFPSAFNLYWVCSSLV